MPLKTTVVPFVLAVVMCIDAARNLTAQQLPAAAPAPATTPKASAAGLELQTLFRKIQGKLGQMGPGPKTEKDFADDLKEFDTLLAKYKGEKTDDVAQILFMKAMLFIQVIDDAEKGVALLKQVKTDFPGTRFAQGADGVIANTEQAEAFKKIQRSLAVGAKFPDFNEVDIAGKPISVANYKGKVVLVDFWATWCGPCIRELPFVFETYQKYNPKGFEIIGISFDQDLQKLTDFTKAQNMPWQQFFDVGASNKLALKYGVATIPTTYLLDGEGKIIGQNLRGEELEKAVAAALPKK